MSASAILTLTLLILHGFEKGIRVNWKRLSKRIFFPLAFVGLVAFALRPFIHLDDYYPNLYKNLRLADVIDHPVEAVVFTQPPEDNRRENPEQQLVEILQTGVLKVGYHSLEMPYCYWNKAGDLVGYDVAYAYQLARDLDCKIEFIPIVFNQLKEELNSGSYDIAMSAIIMSEQRIIDMSFTAPYDEQNFVLIIPIQESKKFLHLDTVVQRKGLKIGGTGVFLDVISRHFPLATPVDATVDGQIELLQRGEIDAMLWERSPAFIWSLIHPETIVIDYGGLIGRGYLSYAFHANSPKFASFLNNWLMLKKLSGFNEKMREYWLDGIRTK
jgi:ABC-type amino acid transport substrate-binding protein